MKATRPRTLETSDVWLTPKYIIDDIGPFDLDPCTEKVRPWPTADSHFTLIDDGLVQDWFGFVWCNPPYGSQTQHWLKKMAEHNNGVALVFARTETKMFFESVWPKAQAIFFIQSRIKFCFPDGRQARENCGAPSVLVAYGKEAVRRLENSQLLGKLIYIK
ncbi:DNA N-6-adenine-methyltransferase [Enterovibrio calviensis]|uniref:DNA N-6-adenine-methyltransferase n=1 Tax=Enterovibrio calviensis TaxID=91359 RepID=UPI000486A649|nr:DNA N-6-adenine-methyltransferase [Enterovibrio calviensis]